MDCQVGLKISLYFQIDLKRGNAIIIADLNFPKGICLIDNKGVEREGFTFIDKRYIFILEIKYILNESDLKGRSCHRRLNTFHFFLKLEF